MWFPCHSRRSDATARQKTQIAISPRGANRGPHVCDFLVEQERKRPFSPLCPRDAHQARTSVISSCTDVPQRLRSSSASPSSLPLPLVPSRPTI